MMMNRPTTRWSSWHANGGLFSRFVSSAKKGDLGCLRRNGSSSQESGCLGKRLPSKLYFDVKIGGHR
eukprot:499653-Pyramimonas_sp.AAC.1